MFLKQGEEKSLPHFVFKPSDSRGFRGAPVKEIREIKKEDAKDF